MASYIDLTGQVFGRLTVLRKAPPGVKEKGRAAWECLCECGNTTTVVGRDLRNCKTRSCGCLKKENFPDNHRHGHSQGKRTREYNAWRAMKKRCLNPKSVGFENYGGRGIKIHEPWIHDFQQFLADVGPAPSQKHSIDHIDPNGHYEPGNVRWATRSEQQNNKRNSRFLTCHGETMTLAQWARRLGLSPSSISEALQRGKSFEAYVVKHLRRIDKESGRGDNGEAQHQKYPLAIAA